MTWDIPQFKALIEGLCDWDKHASYGSEMFYVLADAFDEANDERGKFLRNYIRKQNWTTHLPKRFRIVRYWVLSVTHLHPFEFSLRNTYAYWYFKRSYSDQWKLPGCDWNYDQSVLKVATTNQWCYNKVCRVVRKLNKIGLKLELP